MQFTTAFVALFASVALAAPTQLEDRQAVYIPCSGLYGTSQCCATDVLGIADLDCANRKLPPDSIQPETGDMALTTVSAPTVPTNATDFTAICADVGQRARCCAIPIVSDPSSLP